MDHDEAVELANLLTDQYVLEARIVAFELAKVLAPAFQAAAGF